MVMIIYNLREVIASMMLSAEGEIKASGSEFSFQVRPPFSFLLSRSPEAAHNEVNANYERESYENKNSNHGQPLFLKK